MRYSITNWGGEILLLTDDLDAAKLWLNTYGIPGDALWDDADDALDDPIAEVR